MPLYVDTVKCSAAITEFYRELARIKKRVAGKPAAFNPWQNIISDRHYESDDEFTVKLVNSFRGVMEVSEYKESNIDPDEKAAAELEPIDSPTPSHELV